MEKQCDQCGEFFTFFEQKPGKIPRFCGNACRQRAYRTRKKLAEKIAEVNEIITEAYPNGVPAEVSIAEQLDAIREKIRTDEREKFEKKLADLTAKQEQERSRAIEKIRENSAAEIKEIEDRYAQWLDEFKRVKKELHQQKIDYVLQCERTRQAESQLENERKRARIERSVSSISGLNRAQRRAQERSKKI